MFIITKLLGILTIGASIAIPSFKVTNNYVQNRDVEAIKTIYLDLSKHSDLVEPFVHFRVEEENNTTLSLIDNEIYSFVLPTSVFSSSEYGFEIVDSNNYISEWISGTSKLSESGYNYILLSSGTSIEGYGFYGDKKDNPGTSGLKSYAISARSFPRIRQNKAAQSFSPA